jgi:hypothetical protein
MHKSPLPLTSVFSLNGPENAGASVTGQGRAGPSLAKKGTNLIMSRKKKDCNRSKGAAISIILLNQAIIIPKPILWKFAYFFSLNHTIM